jgi:hypothetical protein
VCSRLQGAYIDRDYELSTMVQQETVLKTLRKMYPDPDVLNYMMLLVP